MLPVAVVAAVGQPEISGPLTAEDGRRLEHKMLQIIERDAQGGPGEQRLVVFEREVNAYLQFQGAAQFPPSVILPNLSILGDKRVRAKVTIALDVLRESRARGVLDLLSYFGGNVPVTVTGAVRAIDGVGSVTLESATVAGVSVPPSVLYELVRFYTRGDSNPTGFDLTAPFKLPYSIREVSVELGRAVVVQ